jgi:lipid-A-disaccharide synthase-like uncharacterized protein
MDDERSHRVMQEDRGLWVPAIEMAWMILAVPLLLFMALVGDALARAVIGISSCAIFLRFVIRWLNCHSKRHHDPP